jgi:hypothetical protein
MTDASAYRALWCAVIIQAFRDLKYRSAHGDGTKEDPALVMSRAYVWVNEEDPKYTMQVGSFEWICSMLDLDSRKLRLMSRSREGVNRVLSGKFELGAL